MEFATFADRAAAIEAEPADLEIVAHVSDLLDEAGDSEDGAGDAEPRTVEIVARFVQGRVFPAWDSTTLDIGPNACYEALARAAGTNVRSDDVEERLAEVGEIGDVAASYDFGGQQGLGAFTGGDAGADDNDLTVREVYETLVDLAAAEGSGSQDRKVDLLFGLFNRCSSEEARYLARLVLSEMRIGVGEGTVRDAIGEAFDVPGERVERALQVSNDYGQVARVAREEGLEGLDAMELEVGRPVQAMLAQAGTVTDALEEWDEAAVEWKYDGARIQLHHEFDAAGESETRVFSRNMEDVTDALPEVVEYAEETLEEPTILDGEVVAIDDDGNPLPFQEVLKRFRRKHDVAKAREDVTVRPVFFDCLHADGEDLLEEPLTIRHERLREVLIDSDTTTDIEPAEMDVDDERDVEGLSLLWLTDDPDEIEAIDADALESGHEGIMLKDPASTYSPGRRGKHWRKRKPDVETLDCVVTGAEWGEGRRATFLGTFELSVRDGDDSAERSPAGSAVEPQNLETVGKVATGITDEKLAELTELLEPHIASEEGQEVDLEPEIVFEVGYEEIQTSPTYSSGYALRFPRFLGVRSDKDPGDADSLERIERLR
ncbi:ATP-dependent DNA ligase LigA [Natronolimnohabitans sp. A-GB9]|uniref:ATP-dependent DNA ligase LigA n=1 Tax=Natronolimnohabitans sp. A-GB9 TaxID=3069757 RepID=UPI0027AFE892|nr:ATP-dependent DNA ligase LigA [Natronolimnohabitans sp. A-GB9]MDQ2051941.1 ATP-dependent DNA ligase LigA [Natronolimnohabitans sp. A-GB9]